MSPTATLFRPEHQLSHAGAVGTPVVNVQVAIMDEQGTLLTHPASPGRSFTGPARPDRIPGQPPGGQRRVRARLVPLRRRRAFRCRRHPLVHRPTQRRHQDRRRERGFDRGRKTVYAVDDNVAEVVVVGLPHERWTEAITAIVVPKPGTSIDEGELIAKVGTHIDPYKAPKAIIVVDELPKTSTGKIQQNVVRDRFSGHYSTG
jgi:AMP-binding enzyme